MDKLRACITGVLLVGLTSCGVSVPADPDGTLDSITGGTLRVGVTESGNWVKLTPGDDPAGTEPALVRDFADALNSDIVWVEGSEDELAEALKHGELELAIGGFAEDTPWTTDAGMTRPYTETTDERGKKVKHVMLIPHGENAFLLELDGFLLSRGLMP